MKNYVYLVLFAFLFAACSQYDDRIFSESSAVRASKYVAECNSILKASAQGWKMVYAPDSTLKNTGVYTFLMKFHDNNRVEMSSEFAAEALTSSYRIDMSQSAVLVFDTYNYIHELSYSNNNPPYGLNGDFEFIIQDKTENRLELIGRKKRAHIILEKATEQDWTNLAKQRDVQQNITLAISQVQKETWTVKLNGADVKGSLTINTLKRTYFISVSDTTITGTYSLTGSGLVFDSGRSLKIGSTTVSFSGLNFLAGATAIDRKFVSNDAGGSLVFSIKSERIFQYDEYLGTYTLRYATSNTATTRNRSLEVNLLPEKQGSTYRLEGLLADDSPGKIYMNYNADGTVSLLGQVMYTYPDTKYEFWLLPYSYPSGGSNYVSRSTTYGLVSTGMEMSSEGKLNFDMIDNKLWSSYTLAGFLLRNYNGSTSVGNVNGKDGQAFYFLFRFEKK